jgi:hypothetical protein
LTLRPNTGKIILPKEKCLLTNVLACDFILIRFQPNTIVGFNNIYDGHATKSTLQ